MKLQLTVLSGGRSGVSGVFSGTQVAVGRHPDNHLQLDPEQDLDVSGRHAVFARSAGRWIVRDAGSRNGTLVNGHPAHGDTGLDDTDQVRLGGDGPVLEVRLVPDSVPDRKPEVRPSAAAAPKARGAPLRRTEGVTQPPEPRRSSTTQRIRIEVGKQTRRLRILAGVLLVVLVAGVGYVVWDRRQQAADRASERAEAQARVDSIVAASAASIARLQGEMEGLASALRRSQDEVQQLQRDLASAEAAGQTGEAARLRRQLASATQVMSLQQAAARVDFRRIYDLRNPAVAMIWTEFAPGDVTTGTAFAVSGDGVLITNRHVVYGPDGSRRPQRLAIQFSNSSQVWRATVLGVSADADLAAIRVHGIVGRIPTIPIPDSVSARPGDPIATIGFPGGTDVPMRSQGEENLVRTTLTAGTIAKALPDLLQIDGYGAQGASGSPIFDAAGILLGVLYGGEAGSNGRIVFAVPVPYITTLLSSLNVSF
jgi:S1-C subfamily serine protease/pSer/pThr/pTyr-binding forkhead associated (FHA) protein